ncbi:tRNA (N(6)-L-threonylcarbamoyladenosine(37)-C(2))-methylthiotransferase MtaB [Massilistercora timonensis]|uniref:tRNA (N(6)-L-threonylcarbamoyladenosine(37)-C(2))- methylthiotransferase MtaB n=1 Tax=Massilistercora timonensis TaxID=2086584 RepID=UPI0032091804
MRKAALHNLGCKVNAYETEAMQELLEQAGYQIVPFEEQADVYIINTCTVTNVADRKSRQMIHRARKKNPGAVIVAAGCYVQTKDTAGLDADIDIVIGNNKKKEIARVLEDYFRERGAGAKKIERLDIGHTSEYEDLTVSHTAGHTRVFLKVQDGCNQFCSYCIIPYARGRVRSRSREEVVAEVRRLAERGYKEVVLTGIHLSSYGTDIGDDLLSLILSVHQVEGICRIRLGSLEPGIITEEFARTLSECPKFCPHFHLSLQSGCDATLKRMNRRYDTAQYEEKCQILRKYFQDPALTTDVIVGFPGETEEEFEASRAFIDRINFYETHIFKYSRREGTRAAVMDGQVPDSVKTKRSALLLELGQKKQREYEEKLLGTTREVLMEESVVIDGETWQVGHTKEYVKIGRKTREDLSNQLVNVEIESRSQIIH